MTKRWIWAVAPTSVMVVAVVYLAAWAADPEMKKPGPPPLKVNKGAPLLLDAGSKKAADKLAGRGHADNESCFVCHGNYRQESLAGVHAAADVGCVKCHGDSFAHRNDEDNITPPDIIYAPRDIEPMCGKCHETHNAPAAKVIARWQERCPAKTNPRDLVCTDCHGEHRLKVRTVCWDKKTRQVLLRQKDKPARTEPDHRQPGGSR
jgi:hypothetical protein